MKCGHIFTAKSLNDNNEPTMKTCLKCGYVVGTTKEEREGWAKANPEEDK